MACNLQGMAYRDRGRRRRVAKRPNRRFSPPERVIIGTSETAYPLPRMRAPWAGEWCGNCPINEFMDNGHDRAAVRQGSPRAAAAAAKTKRKRACPCGCGTLLPCGWVEPKITGITLTVHDKVFATFASVEEYEAWYDAGGPAKFAAALAAADAARARRSPDGVMWN